LFEEFEKEVKDKKHCFEEKVKELEEERMNIEREIFRLGLSEKELEERLRDVYDDSENKIEEEVG
jgi:sugar-specific transcriptional regulator TrmB